MTTSSGRPVDPAPAPRPSPRRDATVLRELVRSIVEAETWDDAVYSTRPDDDWVLIRRSSWARITAATEDADVWRPWSGQEGQ